MSDPYLINITEYLSTIESSYASLTSTFNTLNNYVSNVQTPQLASAYNFATNVISYGTINLTTGGSVNLSNLDSFLNSTSTFNYTSQIPYGVNPFLNTTYSLLQALGLSEGYWSSAENASMSNFTEVLTTIASSSAYLANITQTEMDKMQIYVNGLAGALYNLTGAVGGFANASIFVPLDITANATTPNWDQVDSGSFSASVMGMSSTTFIALIVVIYVLVGLAIFYLIYQCLSGNTGRGLVKSRSYDQLFSKED